MRLSARILSALAVAGLLAGCMSAHDRAIRRSPSFQEGYADGCAAASAQGSNYREGPARDEALYKSDAAYRAGWSNGFQTCHTTQQGIGTTPGSGPIPQPH